MARTSGFFGFVNLYDWKVEDDVKLGTFVETQMGATIGSRCKVSSDTFICEGVTPEDKSFLGHWVTFTNDRHPRQRRWKIAGRIRLDLHSNFGQTWCINRIKGCVAAVGKNVHIDAGSMVFHNVAPDAIAAGNPARMIESRAPKN